MLTFFQDRKDSKALESWTIVHIFVVQGDKLGAKFTAYVYYAYIKENAPKVRLTVTCKTNYMFP